MVDEQGLLLSNLKAHCFYNRFSEKYCPSFPHTGNDFVYNSNVLYLHRLSQASCILGAWAHSRAAVWWAAEGLRGEAMCAPWRAGELWPVSDHVLTETQFHLQDGEGLWGAATGHDQRAATVTSAQIHEAAQMVKRSVPIHLWSPSLMFFPSHQTNTWRTPREQVNQEVTASCWQN